MPTGIDFEAVIREKLPLTSGMHDDTLFVLFDSKGEIRQTWYPQYYNLAIVRNIVARKKNISNIFDVLPQKEGFPPQTTEVRQSISLEILKSLGFQIDMPFLRMEIFRIGEDQHIGRISQAKYLPNIYYINKSIILYIDYGDRLRGYNANLAERLARGSMEGLLPLIGKPVSAIMEPTPAEIQESCLKKTRALPSAGWETVFQRTDLEGRDFHLLNLSLLRFFHHLFRFLLDNRFGFWLRFFFLYRL